MKKISIIVLCSALYFIYVIPVSASTVINQDIATNTVWSAKNSPYILSSNIRVVASTTLEIESGVTINFQGKSLEVDGNLQASGTIQKSITFTGGGIVANHGIVQISNAVFSNIIGAIMTAFNTSTISISSSTATSIVSQDGIDVFNNSNLNLNNVTFASSTFSNNALSFYNNATATIASSTFSVTARNADIAAYDTSASTTTLAITSSIFNTGTTALETYGTTFVSIASSTIQNFTDGLIAFNGAHIIVQGSQIVDNQRGISMYSPAQVQISGSSITYNQQGIMNTSGVTISAQQNWWGDSSGPTNITSNPLGKGDSIDANVNFSNWLTSDPFQKFTCCSSIAFIPGFEGSRLYTEGTFSENRLWEPTIGTKLENLYLNKNGQSINPDIYTRDIIDTTKLGAINIYGGFINSMDSLVNSGLIHSWKALPYDWREDPADIIAGGSVVNDSSGTFDILNFVKNIEQLASTSKTGKVTLIAHSNGGLISKLLVQALQKKGEENLVDKVILVAVPELGTPLTIPSLLHGFGQSVGMGLIMSASTARDLASNMQSAYNLLPSSQYFTEIKDPVVIFDDSLKNIDNFKNYGSTIKTFQKLQDFLVSAHDSRPNPTDDDTTDPTILNSNLLAKANATHSLLDTWQYPATIAVSQIAGWGLDTLQATKYVSLEDCSSRPCQQVLDEEPIFNNAGDNTVLLPSAVAQDDPTYYVDLAAYNTLHQTNYGHMNIVGVTSIQQLIKNIISDNPALPDFVTTMNPIPKYDSLKISVHSPVSLGVYDNKGRYTGLSTTTDPNLELATTDIPNSSYMNFGEGKYITLQAAVNYKINLQGQDYGTFTLDIDTATSTESFTDIPVTPFTMASVELSSTTPILALDSNGDGIVDSTTTATTTFNPILYLQTMRATILSFNLKKSIQIDLLQGINRLINLIEKGKIDKADEKIKKLILRTNIRRPKNVSETEKQEVIDNLSTLLHNLI